MDRKVTCDPEVRAVFTLDALALEGNGRIIGDVEVAIGAAQMVIPCLNAGIDAARVEHHLDLGLAGVVPAVSIRPSLTFISPRTFDIMWRMVNATLLWLPSIAQFIRFSSQGLKSLLTQPLTGKQSDRAIYSHGRRIKTGRTPGLDGVSGRAGDRDAAAGSRPRGSRRPDTRRIRRPRSTRVRAREQAPHGRAGGSREAKPQRHYPVGRSSEPGRPAEAHSLRVGPPGDLGDVDRGRAAAAGTGPVDAPARCP